MSCSCAGKSLVYLTLSAVTWGSVLVAGVPTVASDCRSLYGIHDHDPEPGEYLEHLERAGECGWVTATVAVGADPRDTSGMDFSSVANRGHTVICRINHGYFPVGTIPLPAAYDAFAQRCANFVVHSQGCHIWVIGNESNLPGEWPLDGTRFAFVSPQSYATCFRKVYQAIKAVRPDDQVVPQALAPWAGPFGAGTLDGRPHDANPLSWVEYMREMLTAIAASGPLDGIALHINSRGYGQDDIHSTFQRTIHGQRLYWSFYVYRDWIDRGIPPSLYSLPLYATECNGYYYWKGGHPEAPAEHYQPGWVQEIFAEIDRYHRQAVAAGKPLFRCINLYRWCAFCDGWNIDGDNPYKADILRDLDLALQRHYRLPDPDAVRPLLVATGAVWRYLDDGSNQGTAWRQRTFDDRAWPLGVAQLGYGDGDEVTVVRRRRADGSPIVTTYFRRWFEVPDPSVFSKLVLRLQRDDGAAVYLNGAEVFRSNLPQAAGYDTLALTTVGGADEDTFYEQSVSPALLVQGSNLLAVEIHQANLTSSDVSFDLELRGTGHFPPTVRLTEPASGVLWPAASNLVMTAEAEDTDGKVARVDFYLGRARLGSDTSAPYTMIWKRPVQGDYTLTAVASDATGLQSTSAPVTLTVASVLVPSGAVWRYFDAGRNLGTAWRWPSFSDATWPSGPAQLGYGDGDEATVIGFGPDPNNKYITTYFRHTFTVQDPARIDRLMLRLLRDDGAVVYLNGQEILRSNMPANGQILFNTPAVSAVGGAEEQRFHSVELTQPNLVAGTNLLAVEVHQANGRSSDVSFDLELLAVGEPAAPWLHIRRADPFAILTWPVSAASFQLESAADPSPRADWREVQTPVLLMGNELRAYVRRNGAQQFFRLRGR